MIGYGLAFIPSLMTTISYLDKDFRRVTYWSSFICIGSLYSVCFFAAAYLRMDKIIKRMPELKKSEGYFITAMVFVSMQVFIMLLNFVVTVWLMVKHTDLSDLIKLAETYSVLTILQ